MYIKIMAKHFLTVMAICLTSFGSAQVSANNMPVNCLKIPIDFESKAVKESLELRNSEPRLGLLQKVSLPANASECQIIDFITAILYLSKNQKTYIGTDPQTFMLERAIKGNLALLIPFGNLNYGPSQYVRDVIERNANESNRKMILGSFKTYPYLIEVIAYKNWAGDISGDIYSYVTSQNYRVDESFLVALAKDKSKNHDEILSKMFRNLSMNRHTAIMALKQREGFDVFKEMVYFFNAPNAEDYELKYVITDLVFAGYMPALEWAIDNPEKSLAISRYKDNLSLVKAVLDQDSDIKTIKIWYQKHKKNLKFDMATKKYFVDQ